MDELLTTRQVQDRLQVDRTTVYRMLDDGRLTGVKVGQQWRIPRQEVDALVSGDRPSETNNLPLSRDILPLHCVQPIQDVFAEIAQIGSITTAPDGEPLTHISNCCRFCSLILSSESGRRGCIASWRRLATEPERRSKFFVCHAGLQYARARIEVEGEFTAMLVAGQFYADRPDPTEEATRVRTLAAKYGLDEAQLSETTEELAVLDDQTREQIGSWLERVADTFEDVARERAELMGRLRQIAAMSTLEPS